MRPLLITSLPILLSLFQCAQASSFSRQEQAVEVVFPSGTSGKMDMAMADFGRPKYGGFLIGKLVYPTEKRDDRPASQPDIRCTGGVPCQYGCSDLREATPPFTIPKVPGQFSIMLLDRGPADADPPCWLISKAYNAQLAGADAVLIANDRDGAMVTAVVPEEEDVLQLLDKLTISAALISKSDGNRLKSLYKSNEHVSVKISWANIIPQSTKVHMELWTNSNDECGTLCDEQRDFIHSMKPVAIALQQAGVLDFEPHYLLWTCPPGFEDSTECKTSCILGGQYCAPDPDGSLAEGYSGKDVLDFNIRQLCFHRVAAKDGQPWLWWDFSENLFNNCPTKQNKFTPDCAREVFNTHGGPTLLGGSGLSEWENCISEVEYPDQMTKTSPVLDEELEAQHGRDGEPGIAILPTIRINHVQYRGTLEHKSVTQALCAAFPENSEPSVCKETWVSEDECEVDGPGYAQCRVGDPVTGGRTRCINTFSGYKCDCGQGWVSAVDPETGEEVCEDLNECLATSIPMKDPNCSCPRCACINLPGSFQCTGELKNKCTKENDYNGCWRAKVDGEVHHACKDSIVSYKNRASKGLLSPNETWATCACPACFSPVKNTDSSERACTPNCPMANCSPQLGVCLPEPVPSKNKAASGGGSSWVGTAFVVLLSASLTCLLLYGIYSHYLRERMHSEMKDIMSQYMPLSDETIERRRGGRPDSGGGLDPEAGGAARQPSSSYTAPILPQSTNGLDEEVAGDASNGNQTAAVGSANAQITLSDLSSQGKPEAAQQQEQQEQQKQRQLEQQKERQRQEHAVPALDEDSTNVKQPLVFDGDSSQGPL